VAICKPRWGGGGCGGDGSSAARTPEPPITKPSIQAPTTRPIRAGKWTFRRVTEGRVGVVAEFMGCSLGGKVAAGCALPRTISGARPERHAWLRPLNGCMTGNVRERRWSKEGRYLIALAHETTMGKRFPFTHPASPRLCRDKFGSPWASADGFRRSLGEGVSDSGWSVPAAVA